MYLPQQCRTEDGYLVRQSLMKDVPYGFFTAAKKGCLIALHNHMWEHQLKMSDGTTYWDYFFSNTSNLVQMEQDVGWTTCAGVDPCEQFRKYPGRSRNIHAKENGMGKNVTKFDAILGKPGSGAVGVDWNAVIDEAVKQGSSILSSNVKDTVIRFSRLSLRSSSSSQRVCETSDRHFRSRNVSGDSCP